VTIIVSLSVDKLRISIYCLVWTFLGCLLGGFCQVMLSKCMGCTLREEVQAAITVLMGVDELLYYGGLSATAIAETESSIE
jgi:hypothetical protein